MPVRIDRSVQGWLRRNPEGGTIAVRAADATAAAEAVDAARVEILRRIDPNYMTNALPDAKGVFFWIDGKRVDDFEELPAILAEHLARHGVDDAVITVPRRVAHLVHPNRGLAYSRRAVVLGLYPVPPLNFYNDPPAEVPDAWLDEAAAWVGAGLGDDDTVAVALEGGVEFRLPPGAVRAFYERARTARVLWSLTVAGELDGHLRGANGGFHGKSPHLFLAGGGDAASDDELLAIFDAFVDLARRLAPQLGYAFVGIHAGFSNFAAAYPNALWVLEGGDDPTFVQAVCDEYVFDAFPYQVLGPGHLRHLGGIPAGAAELDGGRVELFVGEPASWLLDPSKPVTRDPTPRRHDPSLQARGRQILAPCLLRKGETFKITATRGKPAGAEPTTNHDAEDK